MGRLPLAVGTGVWLLTVFLIVRLVRFLIAIVPHSCATAFVQKIRDWQNPGELAFLALWVLLGVILWRAFDFPRRACAWLIGGTMPTPGTADRTGMFATLAGFALAQSAALTAAAKGQGRDWIVILVYIVVVIFSYFWTRRVLWSRTTDQFDSTTIQQAQYTLAWIVFLGGIMFTLACYDLLPNQKWRSRYARSGRITCVTRDAREYATSAVDVSFQRIRRWIKWASSGTEDKQVAIWIETGAGFDGNYETFEVNLESLPSLKAKDLVAFLRHQDTPASMPTYRQLAVNPPPGDGNWRITIAEADIGDVVTILCMASNDKHSSLDTNNSFWLMPIMQSN